jgi:hypothetical protein
MGHQPHEDMCGTIRQDQPWCKMWFPTYAGARWTCMARRGSRRRCQDEEGSPMMTWSCSHAWNWTSNLMSRRIIHLRIWIIIHTMEARRMCTHYGEKTSFSAVYQNRREHPPASPRWLKLEAKVCIVVVGSFSYKLDKILRRLTWAKSYTPSFWERRD